MSPEQATEARELQLALKENLKAQIDAMLIVSVDFDDFDGENRAKTVTFKGHWNPVIK